MSSHFFTGLWSDESSKLDKISKHIYNINRKRIFLKSEAKLFCYMILISLNGNAVFFLYGQIASSWQKIQLYCLKTLWLNNISPGAVARLTLNAETYLSCDPP